VGPNPALSLSTPKGGVGVPLPLRSGPDSRVSEFFPTAD
jgi:hypothetical protein